MCGIAGVFGLHHPLPDEARIALRRMTARLAHRGPDGDGFYDAPRAALGHRRLAIIDRAGGHQPMANEDDTCWIAFNGEIYNHRALRPLLESRGHRFRTHSDTEVILHAYEEFGTACVERLEGMFAFAIYDGRKQELFAARDRMGKKPFFYTESDGLLQFSSELPSLAAAPGWRGEVDASGLESYLSLGYLLAPRTIFANVYKLPPASWLLASASGVRVQRYWDVTEFDTDARSTDAILEDLDGVLRRAVTDRLESEVPLGAFLSGGVDSGLVVSYMAEAQQTEVITTSVGFDDPAHNELAAATLVARHFGCAHHPEMVVPELDTVMGPVVDGLGEPLADSSAIPTWYVSRAARRHVTVALSGDGGDECFAGYDFRYRPHAMEAAARAWLPAAATPAMAWLGDRWPRSGNLPRPLRLGNTLQNLARDPAGAYFADLTFMKSRDTQRLMGRAAGVMPADTETYAAVTDAYNRCGSTDPVQRAQYADLHIYLPNDPLVKVDRMSMAHSLEVRSPLLDRQVVEFAFRVPASVKQQGGRGKALLRELARRRLPSEIWTLPKKGFTVPIGRWIAGPSRDAFADEVLAGSARVAGVLDQAELKRRFAAHGTGTRDHSYDLWSVWVLERWLRTCGAQVSPATETCQPIG